MAYKLEFHNPEYPKGIEFDIGGVLVKNGGSLTLTEEQEQGIVTRRGMSVKDALSNNVHLKITGTSELSKKDVNELTGGGE